MTRSRAGKAKKGIARFLNYALLVFVALIFILPIMTLVFGSFKTDENQLLMDMSSFRAFLPVGELGTENFSDVFGRIDVLNYLKNSVIITACSAFFGIVLNSMLGYVLARFTFRGRRAILKTIISLMIIPMEAIAMPLLLICFKMSLINTLTVQILPFLIDPFTIFFFYQGFLKLPVEMEEAALIDGCSYPKIYRSIAMPLSKPTVISVLILCSMGKWGDVFWPNMVTRGREVRPLSIGLTQLYQALPRDWGDIFAFALIMTIPIMAVFFIFQKQFMESVATTGIKG